MKPSITFTHPFALFFGIALLLNPVTSLRSAEKVNEIKTERQQPPLASENASELLHSELLFRY
jgi:hypothetical protein